MGTPDFAVPSLRALAAVAEVVGVVSQPTRPRGRGLTPSPSPVARTAADLGMPLITPERIRDPEALATLAAWHPDLLVVAAYGKILPRAVLELPRLAALNVHASLLPRHRGAAPIAAAILAGDERTGVTIMLMAEELDAGDTLLHRALAIAPTDTTATLEQRLAELGGHALADAIEALRGPGLVPVPQDPLGVTYCPRLTREDGRIDWAEPATVLARRVRAFAPWPSTFTMLGGRMVKVLEARVATAASPLGAAPGSVVGLDGVVRVATGDGTLDLLTLQLEGRKALPAATFVAGARLAVGARFDA